MTQTKDIFPGVFILLILLFSPILAAENWVLEKKNSGIAVYLREVPGSHLKEYRGITYLKDTTLESIEKLFEDTDSYTRWMHNCIEAKLLKMINENERYTYIVIDSPWPVKDRDVITYSKVVLRSKTRGMKIAISGRPKYVPERSDCIRIQKMKGYWLFQPHPDGTIKVTYQIHSEPGGHLPDWLANATVVDIPYNTLLKLKTVIKEKKYR
jgi:hypothetical protein